MFRVQRARAMIATSDLVGIGLKPVGEVLPAWIQVGSCRGVDSPDPERDHEHGVRRDRDARRLRAGLRRRSAVRSAWRSLAVRIGRNLQLLLREDLVEEMLATGDIAGVIFEPIGIMGARGDDT